MDALKLLVVTLAILSVSVLILDVTTATIHKDNMRTELKQQMLSSMEQAIHLGELRKGNLSLNQEQFLNHWRELDNAVYEVNAQIVQNSPALVAVEGKGKMSHLSRLLGVSETPMNVKYVALVDLREEEENQ